MPEGGPGTGAAAAEFAGYTDAALCARIWARHRATIRVQKQAVAVANLLRIVQATLRLSNEKGFHATSLRDLSRASGLSMGGLYAYIDSKETLLAMILNIVADSGIEIMADPPAAIAADPRRHLRWLIGRHIGLTEVMQPWFAFAFMEAKAFPAAARRKAVESEAATEAAIAEVLARGAAAGAFRLPGGVDAGLTAALIKPLMQDWYVKRAKYRKRGTTVEAYAAAVSDLVLAALEAG